MCLERDSTEFYQHGFDKIRGLPERLNTSPNSPDQ